jgi:hypothetical protein
MILLRWQGCLVHGPSQPFIQSQLAIGHRTGHTEGVDTRTDDLAAPRSVGASPSTLIPKKCEFDGLPRFWQDSTSTL